MGAFAVGDVVLFPFPHTDGSDGVKLRPTVVIADLPRQDCILCFVTSQRPSPLDCCLPITNDDMKEGSLREEPSFILPMKLFTVTEARIKRKVATLSDDVTQTLLALIRDGFTG